MLALLRNHEFLTQEEFLNELRQQRTVTINRPAAELYELWRNEENAPLWMEHTYDVLVGELGVDPEQFAELLDARILW